MSQTPANKPSQKLTFDEWVNQNPEVQYFTEKQQRQAYQRYLKSPDINIPYFEEWLEQNPELQYFPEERQREVYAKIFQEMIDLKQNKNGGLRKLILSSMVLLFGLVIVGNFVKPPRKTAIFTNNVKLRSSFGMNYKKLRDLLAAEKWKEADQETSRVIEEVIERKVLKQKRSFMPSPNINEVPCEDLHTIDNLWVKYSDGHFGFSVQKQIFQAEERKSSDAVNNFLKKVGWAQIGYSKLDKDKDITFSINAPEGHLPVDAYTYLIYVPHDHNLRRLTYIRYNNLKQKYEGVGYKTLKDFEVNATVKMNPSVRWIALAWTLIPQSYGYGVTALEDKDNCKL